MIVTQLNQEAEKMEGTGRGKLFKSAANEILALRQRVEELESQQSEVAALAVEDAAGIVTSIKVNCIDNKVIHSLQRAETKIIEYANQLRKGEGDE